MKEKITLKSKPKSQDLKEKWTKEIESFLKDENYKQNMNNLGWFCIARAIGLINLENYNIN
jgi:hypothetical protein